MEEMYRRTISFHCFMFPHLEEVIIHGISNNPDYLACYFSGVGGIVSVEDAAEYIFQCPLA